MLTRLTVTLAATICLLGCNKASEPSAEKPVGKPAPAGQAEGAQKNEMKSTASGLKYQVLKQGTGTVSPKATDTVKVHYHGTLLNGTVFDSSVERGEPISFPLNRVIPGWTEALQLMKVGGKSRVVAHFVCRPFYERVERVPRVEKRGGSLRWNRFCFIWQQCYERGYRPPDY